MIKSYSLFKTDGFRGKINKYPILPGVFFRLSLSFNKKRYSNKFLNLLVGYDTRFSRYTILSSLISGLYLKNTNIFFLGIITTPALSFLTRLFSIDLGIIITASHNLYFDNGIKLFTHNGLKLNYKIEKSLEYLIIKNLYIKKKQPSYSSNICNIFNKSRFIDFYVNSIFKHFIFEIKTNFIKIIIDSANGSTYKLIYKILKKLKINSILLGIEPNGFNINKNIGATYIKKIQYILFKQKKDIGFSLDGDGDRLSVILKKNKIINSHHFIYNISQHFLKKKNYH